MTLSIKPELRGALSMAGGVALLALALASIDLRLPAQDVFQSLRFHLAAAALLVPLLLLAAGARWRALFMLLSVLASIAQGGWIIYGQQSLRGHPDPSTAIRVLSFNVLANSEQGQNVADYMIALQPDVAAIMETPGIERALGKLSTAFPYRLGCDVSASCDLSLFSRTPLLNGKVHLLGSLQRERLITATTIVNGQIVTIVALHLSKPYFDGAAAAELWEISHVIEAVDGPMLIVGDFNGTAWSANVSRFVRRNALVPPPFYPATWPVRLGAFGVPIDNIFTGGGLVVDTIEATAENFGSNHRGLVATVRMAVPQ